VPGLRRRAGPGGPCGFGVTLPAGGLDEFVRANPDDAYDHAKRAAATEDAGTGLHDAVAALLDTAGEQAAE